MFDVVARADPADVYHSWPFEVSERKTQNQENVKVWKIDPKNVLEHWSC